jgi:acyl-homoserine lactone synthase
MIERLSGSDEPHYPHLFRQMYQQRHEIYVTRRKWGALKPVGDLEKDQFDTASATYLLALGGDDRVLAGLRLLSTCGPHLFADVFPHLAQNGPVPRGADILELTRFYVACSVRGPLARRLVGVLAAGLFEHCLVSGIGRLTSVVDTFLVPRMDELGWQVQALGAPGCYGEGRAVAVEIAVTQSALDALRRRRGIDEGVLRGRSRARPPRAVVGAVGLGADRGPR